MRCESPAKDSLGHGVQSDRAGTPVRGDGAAMRTTSPSAQHAVPRAVLPTARQLPFTPSSIPVGECGSDYAARRGLGGWDAAGASGRGGHGGAGRGWEGREWSRHGEMVRRTGSQADDTIETRRAAGCQRDGVPAARSLSRERERSVPGRDSVSSSSAVRNVSPVRGCSDRRGAHVGVVRGGYRERRDLSPPRSLTKGGRCASALARLPVRPPARLPSRSLSHPLSRPPFLSLSLAAG